MKNKFFAFISRMKYVDRWSLFRNTQKENLREHGHEVAVLAHALGIIKNKFYGGKVNPYKAATLALYHDSPEIITSDLPSPIKYMNPEITRAFKAIEKEATLTILAMAPEAFKEEYTAMLLPQDVDHEEWILVKEADKLAAHIKCIEELRAGNLDFQDSYETTKAALDKFDTPEMLYFRENFLEAFGGTLNGV